MYIKFEDLLVGQKFSKSKSNPAHFEKVEIGASQINTLDLNSGELLHTPEWYAVVPEAWFKTEVK
jgi:hypothetical protein